MYNFSQRTRLQGFMFLVLSYGVVISTAFAGQEFTEQLAVKAALQNNVSLRQAQAEMEAARARIYEGISALLPSVTINGHYNKLSAAQFPAEFLGPLSAAIPPSLTADQYYDAGFSVKQPLFAWGANFNRFQQGRLDFVLAQEKYRQQRLDTIYQARELYDRVLLAAATAAIAHESLELSQRRLDMTQKQAQLGKLSQYELNRANVALTNDRVVVSKAEKDHRRALSSLKSFLQSTEELTVSGSLPFIAHTYTMAGLLDAVRTGNPRLAQARLTLSRAHAELAMAEAGLLPAFFVGYTRTLQRPFAECGAWDSRWQAQLGMEWTVLNGLNAVAGLQRAGNDLQSTSAGLEATQATLELDAQAAFLDYQQALESLKLQEANIELAERNRSIAEEKFNLGLIPVLELQDVQLALSQARLNDQQARYDYALAAATIDRLSGLLNEE